MLPENIGNQHYKPRTDLQKTQAKVFAHQKAEEQKKKAEEEARRLAKSKSKSKKVSAKKIKKISKSVSKKSKSQSRPQRQYVPETRNLEIGDFVPEFGEQEKRFGDNSIPESLIDENDNIIELSDEDETMVSKLANLCRNTLTYLFCST